MRFLLIERPRNFISSGGLGTMGYGIPAAIGDKAARPEAKVVCVAVNTAAFANDDDARRAISEIAEETGLPADDPVRFGAQPLLDALLARL